MVHITMTRDEVDAMLSREAERYGYTYEELRVLALSGELVEAELRDLWIIWGDAPLGHERRQ